MTANARPLCRSAGSTTSFIVLLFPPNQAVFSYIHHYCLTVRLQPNSFLPLFRSEAEETIKSRSAPTFRVRWVFIQGCDPGSTVATPCSLFPGLGLKLQLFWKKRFRELHNWWPVFLLWVFSQYLWGLGGIKTACTVDGSPSSQSSSSSDFLVLIWSFDVETWTLRRDTGV